MALDDAAQSAATAPEAKVSSRSKRAAILETATREFARTGYRASKWSDIADSVGIGSTALYHYFVSKDHCLFTIMAEASRKGLTPQDIQEVLKRAHRHWEQGVKHGKSGDWARAEAAFLKAVQAHPADPLG